MGYATVDDLKQRLGVVFTEIYDSDEAAAEADLQGAAAEIDGALACRYRVPVAARETLSLLKDWNLTLAEERTYSRAAGSQYAEKIKRRVDQVRSYLEMIRLSRFSLSGAEENATESALLVDTEEPVFSRNKLRGF